MQVKIPNLLSDAHLIIREVIPMLRAIKILLVCFLNNARVSLCEGERRHFTTDTGRFKLRGNLKNASELKFMRFINQIHYFCSGEPEERW